ncbi:hypothetical protein [Myxacorys almedinensis]|uniref:hypothetical protein n=1 Tax=Myxacorys almedinensis TaxID=2651157 RepID=UPI0030831D51
MSQKFSLYADRAEQLQQRGVSRRNALMVVSTRTTVMLSGEWLEAFWCDECQQTQWYHIHRLDNNRYQVALAPAELWQQAIGVINAQGNPSVSEFTQKQSRMVGFNSAKEFRFVG